MKIEIRSLFISFCLIPYASWLAILLRECALAASAEVQAERRRLRLKPFYTNPSIFHHVAAISTRIIKRIGMATRPALLKSKDLN